jgi:ADP-ribose pyrophosphatase
MTIPSHADKVFTGKTFAVYQWQQKMFDGNYKTFEKLKRNNTVDVVAISEDGQFYILEEQQPGRPMFYGLIGGTCEDGEQTLETAQRELLEETGLVSDNRQLFNSYTLSSRIDYTSNIFIARNCKVVDVQHLDPGGEHIVIKKVDREQFLDIIADPQFRV